MTRIFYSHFLPGAAYFHTAARPAYSIRPGFHPVPPPTPDAQTIYIMLYPQKAQMQTPTPCATRHPRIAIKRGRSGVCAQDQRSEHIAAQGETSPSQHTPDERLHTWYSAEISMSHNRSGSITDSRLWLAFSTYPSSLAINTRVPAGRRSRYAASCSDTCP